MRIIVPLLTRVLSVLLAVALIGAGAVLMVEVAAAWLGAGWTILPPDTVARASTWQWDDDEIVVAIASVGGVALLALLVGLWRRPPLTIGLEGCEGVAVERYALEGSLRRRLEALDGVSSARVRAGRRRVSAKVDTRRRHEPAQLKNRVEESLAEMVDAQHVGLKSTVRLRSRGGEL